MESETIDCVLILANEILKGILFPLDGSPDQLYIFLSQGISLRSSLVRI
jgi:hypothetical protein